MLCVYVSCVPGSAWRGASLLDREQPTYIHVYWYTYTIPILQIGDFGMARDITDESFYMSSGGLIPVRWTAPEV